MLKNWRAAAGDERCEKHGKKKLHNSHLEEGKKNTIRR